MTEQKEFDEEMRKAMEEFNRKSTSNWLLEMYISRIDYFVKELHENNA